MKFIIKVFRYLENFGTGGQFLEGLLGYYKELKSIDLIKILIYGLLLLVNNFLVRILAKFWG